MDNIALQNLDQYSGDVCTLVLIKELKYHDTIFVEYFLKYT
jgi:hypothetical protein